MRAASPSTSEVLHTEVDPPGLPEFDVVFALLAVGELEQLDADLVAGGEVSDAERTPARAKHVVAHHADGGVILGDGGRLHDEIPAHHLGIELDRFVEVSHRDPDMREVAWIRLKPP